VARSSSFVFGIKMKKVAEPVAKQVKWCDGTSSLLVSHEHVLTNDS
jgi:hypothetical protein